jgi:hypothetical protein
MQAILNNPYRIAGVLANISAKEFQKQKSMITKYASIGKKIESNYDFTCFGHVDRNEKQIYPAFSKIEQNNDKIRHSIFWFVKANTFDETAINYLADGDTAKAEEIWGKVTSGKEITSKNYSCFNNIGTLKLLQGSIEEIKVGVESKIKLIESPFFLDFVDLVADRATYNFNEQNPAVKFADDILGHLKDTHNAIDIISVFDKCESNIKKHALKHFTDKHLQNIETCIENTKTRRKEDKLGAYIFGLDLINKCTNELETLKHLLGQADLSFKMISDNLAKETLQCGIDFYLASNKDENSADKAVSLLEKAKVLTKNPTIIERIQENIKELSEIRYKDILKVILILRQLKIFIIDLEKSNLYKTIYEQKTINTAAVDLMLNKDIPSNLINKIAKTDKDEFLKEFILLLEYLRGKLNSSGIDKIIRTLEMALPETHPFVIAEIKRKEAKAELRRKQEQEERIRKVEQERWKKENDEKERKLLIKILSISIIVLFIVGAIWGWTGVIIAIVLAVIIFGNANS